MKVGKSAGAGGQMEGRGNQEFGFSMAVGGTPKCLVTPGNRQQGAEATSGLRLENRDGY